MKEAEMHLTHGITTELNVKKRKEVEHKLIGNILPEKGHKVWEVNEETGEIIPAKYKNETYYLTVNEPEKLVVNPGCVYIPALNAMNAKKKYLKDKRQESYYTKEAPFKLSEIFNPHPTIK